MGLVSGNQTLDETAFVVGTESGLVQRCLIQRPQERDIRSYLTSNPKVTWSEEAFGFLGNIFDQKSIQKIKDHIDRHMMDVPSATKHVYANHIFASKPPID